VHYTPVLSKVAIGRKDLPIMPKGHRTYQHFNWRSGHTRTAALITDPRSLLIVALIHSGVWEVSQVIANPVELGLFTNTRQHFLSRRTEQLHLPLFD
jgi:hypothetical protein